jgi:serine/threonine-protein kinase PknG
MNYRCQQIGCNGTVEDGYCNTCGHAAAKGVAHTGQQSPQPPQPALQQSPQPALQQRSQDVAYTSGYQPSQTSATGSVVAGSAVAGRSVAGSRRSAMRQGSRASNRQRLGAGLLHLPAPLGVAPEALLLASPTVPEHKRFCPHCDKRVKREQGFCGHCGQKYSFLPTLQAGDVLAEQYEVRGALAYGGLGWIYLAFDRMLSRYVVLKGLLNSFDAASAQAALAERQFLARLKHPNIVSIYNFSEREIMVGGVRQREGFIVMEYVAGQTLKSLRQQRGPLPVLEALAYIHRILGAFGYLHQQKLVYCDFKPDNVMLEYGTDHANNAANADSAAQHLDIKLIDLGGVRQQDDLGGDIYGTVGYSAPEAASAPSPASDLYTVGRTLLALLGEVRGFTSDLRFELPSPAAFAPFARSPSLYRLLQKATTHDPEARFQGAEQMAEQVLGVMREISAQESGKPRPAASNNFGPDRLAEESGALLAPVLPNLYLLPSPALDESDLAFATLQNLLLLPPSQRVLALRQTQSAIPTSFEARWRLAEALLATAGQASQADQADDHWQEASLLLDDLTAQDPWDWRLAWLRGQWLAHQQQHQAAEQAFATVFCELPGELAPKLALGLLAELSGQAALALEHYQLVLATDPSFVAASFGLARCLTSLGKCREAVAALGAVAQNSPLWGRAQVESLRLLLANTQASGSGRNAAGVTGRAKAANRPVNAATPTLAHDMAREIARDISQAATLAQGLLLSEQEQAQLGAEVLPTVLRLLEGGQLRPGQQLWLGQPLEPRALRRSLEQHLRTLARLAPPHERVALVDAANQVRPQSWW